MGKWKDKKYTNIYITSKRMEKLKQGKVVFCNNRYRLVPTEYRKTEEQKKIEQQIARLKAKKRELLKPKSKEQKKAEEE